ncbi:hypothetical protein J1N35_018733 [Gossypium stocksii]|uniref:Uncharacterized protein n=1 Tax=Gossypium stocksii TaxID=47602 RepID=A0A9D3VPN5_9ROSI|nr:hypothetical protein J1N35_018733 [Gossypium stocksii]
MHELRTRIRRKVRGSSRGRISRLQYKFLTFIDPYKYELFDVISETHLETVTSSHISSRNVVIELYVKFAEVDGSGLSSTFIAVNTNAEDQAESLTTQLCSGFSSLLQSSYYNVLGTTMGRNSLISGIDLNFKDQY